MSKFHRTFRTRLHRNTPVYQVTSNMPKIAEDKTDAMDSKDGSSDEAETSKHKKPVDSSSSRIENDSDTEELQSNGVNTKADDSKSDGYEAQRNQIYNTSQRIDFQTETQQKENSTDQRLSKTCDAYGTNDSKASSSTLRIGLDDTDKETELTRLRNEIYDLEFKTWNLDHVEEEKNNLEKTAMEQAKKVKELQEKNESLEKQLKHGRQMQTDINALREKCEALTDEIDVIENENKNLQAKIEQQQPADRTALKQITDFECRIGELENLNSNFKQRISETENKYDLLVKKHKEKECETELLKRLLEDAQLQLEEKRHQFKDQQDKSTQIRSENLSLKEKINEHYEEVMEKKAKWASVWESFIKEQTFNREERDKLERRRLELDEMKNELQANQKENMKKMNEMLKNEENMKTTFDNLSACLVESKEKFAIVQEKLDKAVDDVTKHKADLSQTKEENKDLQSKLLNVEAKLKEKNEKVSQVEKICDQTKRNEAILKEENAKLKDEVLQQTSQMLKDRKTMDQLREVEQINAQRIREQGELIENLNKEIRDWKELIAKLEEEKQEQKDDWTSKYRQKTKEFELESINYQKTLDEKTMLQNCMSAQEKEIKTLQELQKTQVKNIQDLKIENKQKEDEIKRLTDRVQTLDKSMRHQTEMIYVEREQHACVKGLLSTKVSEKEKADMSSIALSSEIRVLQAHLAARDQRIQKLSVEKENVRARLDASEIRLGTVVSLEEKIQQYREQNQRLRDELEKATSGYQRAIAMSGDRNSEYETLKQENTRLKKEIRCCKEKEETLLAAKRTLEEQNQSLQMDLNDSFSF